MIEKLSIILPSIVSIISLIWGIINARNAKKETKENERLKTELNQKTHIRESVFDYEFDSYVRLMGLLNAMLDCNFQLFPHISRKFVDDSEERKRKSELYKASIESRNKFILALGETRPFIDEEIYKQFSDIQTECMKQIILYEDYMISDRFQENRDNDREGFMNAFKNQDKLVEKFDTTSFYIKAHLFNYYH